MAIENLFARVDSALQRRLRPPFREMARRLVYAPVDAAEWLLGKGGRSLPPRGLRFVGAGDFAAVGLEFRDLLIEECGLDAQSRVLDVGCGVGRLAIPLAGVLNDNGSYDGFDISKPAIRWCSRRISKNHPNFRFQHVDVANLEYNPKGRLDPTEFSFPYPDESFDCCVAMSVFTHLLEGSAEQYLRETVRVLRMGGVALLTFFIVNDETRRLRDHGEGTYSFRHRRGSAHVDDLARPETAVAYDEAAVMGFLSNIGLEVREPPYFGAWSGRRDFKSFQDIVVARRVSGREAQAGHTRKPVAESVRAGSKTRRYPS